MSRLKFLPLIAIGIFFAPTCAHHAEAQTMPRATVPSCDAGRCSSAWVEAISKGGPSDVVSPASPDQVEPISNDITVADDSHMYQLTCSLDDSACLLPAMSGTYKLIVTSGEKPDRLGDFEGEFPSKGKLAYLIPKAGGTLGPYWVVAVLPSIPLAKFQDDIQECKNKENGINTNDCARWLSRRSSLLRSNCNHIDSAAACESISELLNATDPDILDILARISHAYLCPHPGEDTFFVMFFSEPTPSSWRKSDADEQKLFGLGPSELMQFGLPGTMYFDKGVINKSKEISDIGAWKFLPLSKNLHTSDFARLATSVDASFGGKHFNISGSVISISEKYENHTNKAVQHEITIQRSTGRFIETYRYASTGKDFLNYEGTCLIASDGN